MTRAICALGSVSRWAVTGTPVQNRLNEIFNVPLTLTLTAAPRAYLMEPHWNPTLEEQALARVHRLGQKQEVTTVSFYVRDSIEEQVMKLQESKKQLVGVLLSNHDYEQDRDNIGSLERSRTLH
ncbi:hypothetical protein GGS26DRAFT_593949 [Hypomontagnella submonticulosa]|nr:hypothetical protein GGS26DRAFT_593949 [Hypomontagnella submonticulosa]